MPLQHRGIQPPAPSLSSGQENYTTAWQQPRGADLSKALVSMHLSLMSRAWGELTTVAIALAFFLFMARPFQGFPLPSKSSTMTSYLPSTLEPQQIKETTEDSHCYTPCLAQVTQQVTAGQQGSAPQSLDGMSNPL